MGWYNSIINDISVIPDAINYYSNELQSAREELKISGNIEKLLTILPGVFEYRFNQLQELEAILEYLNIELRKSRSKYFKKYLENYQRSLSSREVEKYIDGEDEIIGYEQVINDFALIRNKWLGFMKALDQKSYSLNNVIKLRVAGLEDATL